jgi:predicted GNAT family acetyltransferase
VVVRTEKEDSTVETLIQKNPEQSRYELIADDTVAGVVEYREKDDFIELTHTEVDPSHEGEGLGSQLARAVLDSLRNDDRSVIPSCPFIRSYLQRHSEYADLVPADRRADFGL